jgi:hypothetical protein
MMPQRAATIEHISRGLRRFSGSHGQESGGWRVGLVTASGGVQILPGHAGADFTGGSVREDLDEKPSRSDDQEAGGPYQPGRRCRLTKHC